MNGHPVYAVSLCCCTVCTREGLPSSVIVCLAFGEKKYTTDMQAKRLLGIGNAPTKDIGPALRR